MEDYAFSQYREACRRQARLNYMGMRLFAKSNTSNRMDLPHTRASDMLPKHALSTRIRVKRRRRREHT